MFHSQIETAERERIAKKARGNKSLADAGTFAVRDAVTFKGCIAAGKDDEVLARATGITEEMRPDVLQVAIPKVKSKEEQSSPAIEQMRQEKEERERMKQEEMEKKREILDSARGFGSFKRGGDSPPASVSSSFDLSEFAGSAKRKIQSRTSGDNVKPREDIKTSSPPTSKRHLEEIWTIDEIRRVAQDVEDKRAAECQSFAAYLVAKLADTLDPSVRVQIVAHKDKKGLGTHNYVLINFKGDDLSYEEIAKQKNTVLIGDLWLLALGHDQVKSETTRRQIDSNGIYTFSQYPIDHVMLKDLSEIYDSDKTLRRENRMEF